MERVGIIALAAALFGAVTSAGAQTPSNPQQAVKAPESKWLTPAPTTKAPSPQRTKSCSQYGAGYIYVPSADTCVKIGGSVEMDVKGR